MAFTKTSWLKTKFIKQILNQKRQIDKAVHLRRIQKQSYNRMKQLLSLILAASLIMISCNSADNKPADVASIMQDSTKFTTIQWLDTAIDFGSRKMGEMVSITFRCKNTGNKPLYLFNVHPSCGCTLTDYTKEPIAPGQEGKIDAQFDTKKSHPGEVHKSVFVNANASNPAPNTLKFSVIVLAADSTQTTKQ
jgi:hypothetical protein